MSLGFHDRSIPPCTGSFFEAIVPLCAKEWIEIISGEYRFPIADEDVSYKMPGGYSQQVADLFSG